MIRSNLNEEVYDALNTYSINAIIARLHEDEENMQAIDISKSYSSALINNKDDYPIYSIFDSIETFDGKITNGEYYINTDINLCDNTIILPNGFYPVNIVKYFIEKQVITLDNITHQLKPKTVLHYDYFKKYTEDIYNTIPHFSSVEGGRCYVFGYITPHVY